MDEPSTTNQDEDRVNDFYLPDEKQIKKLREILWSESGFKFSYKEIEEISFQLISLYECLARGKPIRPLRGGHEPG